MRLTALRLGAVVLWATAWCLALFGFAGFGSGDVPFVPRGLFYVLSIGGSCLAVGAAIGRWWAPAVGFLFVALLPLGDHCVTRHVASDIVDTACSGVAASELPFLLAVTTPGVIAGVAAVRRWQRARGRAA